MYKIMIHIDTHTNDTWFYYQEEGKDYVADSLEEIRETVLTLIDVYGEDYIKIVKQETGDDMNGSVETFLYDSTDNYEELVNRPFINGVEIVGALSLAELGIQPVGNYATNERVDALEETVNNIDFSPYATNARVDQVEYKVDNIDLTPYATNERVDQVEAKVDAIDLEPYATMDYLDEVVAGIDFSASNENITGVKTFSVLPRSTVMPVTEDELTNKSYVDHEVLGCATETYVDEAIANTKMPVFTLPALGAVAQYTYMDENEAARFFDYCSEHRGEYIHVYIKCGTTAVSGIYSGQLPTEHLPGSNIAIFKLYSNISFYRSGVLYGATLNTYTTITEDGYTQGDGYNRPGIELSGTGLGTTQFLSKTNTNYYSPTGDYNPATKKYVDDSVATLGDYVDEQLANTGGSSASQSAIYQINTEKYLSVPATYTNESFLATIGEAFTKYFNGETGIPTFRVTASDPMCLNPDYIFELNLLNGLSATYYATRISRVYTSDAPKLYIVRMTFTLTETDGVYSTKSVDLAYTSQADKILTATNTESYTPTSYYHPATKKYVDDAVANIDVPDVDLTNYYNKEEVNSLVEDPTKRRIYNVEFNMSGGSDILGPNTLNQIGEMITNWYKTSERSMLMFASFWSGNNDGIRYAYIYQGLYTWNTGSYYDKTTGLNYQNKVFQFNKLSDNAGKVFDSVSIRMEGTWDNDVYTCTKCAFTVGTDLAAEIKTIKNDYAKTADVATMINAAIGNVLEGGY